MHDREYLITRLKWLYDKTKMFPEKDPQGWIRMREIHALIPEVVDMLEKDGEFISVPKLDR